MGTHFVLFGMGHSAIAYFAFCIVSKLLELPIFNQSIHYQIDKIKNCVLGGLAFLVYLHHADATGTHISVLCGSLKYGTTRQTMNKKKVTAILIFLLCVTIPILTLSLFPTPCGYGLCLLVYYPIIFLIGGLSAWTYFKFSDGIKLNKTTLILIILFVDFALLTYFYPKGEYFPTNQIRVARQVADNYDNLKPVDIFKAAEDRNFLMITALYHKFNLPTETYNVRYCFIDTNGSCDTIHKEFNYFISDNNVVTNNSDFHSDLDLKEGSFSFRDTVEKQGFVFKVGYPDFGKYRKDFTNTSSDLSDKGERVTGLVKDIGTLRVIVDETQPKFEYRFTRLFEKYLSWSK